MDRTTTVDIYGLMETVLNLTKYARRCAPVPRPGQVVCIAGIFIEMNGAVLAQALGPNLFTVSY